MCSGAGIITCEVETMSIEKRYEKLKQYLQELGSVAIGFSGGVDSSFLATVAKQVLGDKVIAITVQSVFNPRAETEFAQQFAADLSIVHEILHVDVLAIENVADNPSNRCYYCKKALFSLLKTEAGKRGINIVVDGSNMDDLDDYRPGIQALEELKIKSPLRYAGLTKNDIRKLSQKLGIVTWNKPSAACLASRIPYNEILTKEKLARIEKAEEFLAKYGFGQLRVRCHKKLARLEVKQEDFVKLLDPVIRTEIIAYLRKLGFLYITLDLQGYRTGSFNEVL